MKKLFIISLLLCSGICKGQELKLLNDSMATAQGDTFKAPISFVTLQNNWHHEIEVGKLDTVPCMILAADTCLCYAGQAGFIDFAKALEQEGFAYYIKGYKIRIGASDIYNEYHYWKFVKYLDADKKPLPKNIVIWISNELK